MFMSNHAIDINPDDFNFNSFIQQEVLSPYIYNITLKEIERLVVKELAK